jgi:hypothetical protein
VLNITNGSDIFNRFQFTFNGMSVVNLSQSSVLLLQSGGANSAGLVNIDQTSILQVLSGTLSAGTIVNNGSLGLFALVGNPSISATSILNYGQLQSNGGQISGTVTNYGTITSSALVGINPAVQFTDLINQGGTITLGQADGLAVTGKLTQNAGLISLGVYSNLTASNPIEIDGGTLSGSGIIQGSLVNMGGTVNPTTGLFNPVSDTFFPDLTVTGDYTQGAGGTLLEDFSYSTQFGFNLTKLVVDGTANLAGTFELEMDQSGLSFFESNLSSLLGGSFLVMQSGLLNGMFTNFELVDSSLNSVALPLDYGFDFSSFGGLVFIKVVERDCSALGQAMLDGTALPSSCGQITPGTTITPVTDFVPTNITLTQAPPSVPEPGTLLLLASGLAVIAAYAYRKRMISES